MSDANTNTNTTNTNTTNGADAMTTTNTNTTTNDSPQAVWTKPDGTFERGTFAELGPKYWAASSREQGHALTPLIAAEPVAVAAAIEVVETAAERSGRRVALSNRSNWACKVDQRDEAAAANDAAALVALGVTPGRTLFAPGTPLVAWGVDKWRAERQALDALPRLTEAAQAVATQVRSEARKDSTVPAHRLRLAVDGGQLVLHRGGGGLRIERHGLAQLAGRMPGFLPPTGFTRTMLAQELADLWNQRAERGLLENVGDVVLRHRQAVDGAGRSVYAVVSPAYGAHDADRVMRDLSQVVGGFAGHDVTAAITYDADKVATSWEVLSMREGPPVVGEVWKMGLKGGTRDDGRGSLWNAAGFWRAICCNLTTEELETARSRQRHRGANIGVAVREQLADAWRALRGSFDGFGQRWDVLNSTAAVDVLGGVDVAAAIERLCDADKGLRDAAGVKRDTLVQLLLNSHSMEGGESIASVVNAVTRLHEAKLPAARLQAVELRAGQLAKHWAGEVASA